MTSFVEWALGVMREHTQHQIVTSFDRDTQAIFASNYFDASFADRVAFSWISEPLAGYTADRREFIGRNGDLTRPDGLASARPSARRPARPSTRVRAPGTISLAPNETRDVIVLLGAARGVDEARPLIGSMRRPARRTPRSTTVAEWAQRLGRSRSRRRTPFDAMINRWSLYQALSCACGRARRSISRAARTASAISLQDVMAFVYHDPAIAREHILPRRGAAVRRGRRAALVAPAHGRGTRTRFSDDLVWLPYVVDHYIRTLATRAVLDEEVRSSRCGRSNRTSTRCTICLRSRRRRDRSTSTVCVRCGTRSPSARTGCRSSASATGNDGMNRVGIEGRRRRACGSPGSSTTRCARSPITATARATARRGELRVIGRAVREGRERGGVGRRVVSPRLLRRRHPVRLGAERRVPDRLDRAELERDLRRRGPDKRAQAMASLERHSCARTRGSSCCSRRRSTRRRTTRLHQGLSARRARERRAVHARRALGRARDRTAGDGDRAFELYQMINPLTHAVTPEDVRRYKVEPYVVAADVYTATGTSGAAAGRGTRARRRGCIASGSRRSWASRSMARRSRSSRACRGVEAFSLEYRYASSTYA
jgi:cyclic beta-1,2-glucan synthetase